MIEVYKFVDLFCGIGGFRVALEKRGLECVFSSDIDSYVQEVYKKNFGEIPAGDITKIPANKIPKHNILCAGFPCQPFSVSGKRGGTSDPRGKLFYEITRIIDYHKPYIVLLENVTNIMTIDNGSVIKTIKTKLSESGYDLFVNVLNSSYFGIPQARKRAYFVALRKDSYLKYIPPKEDRKEIFLDDVLEEKVDADFCIDRKRKDIQISRSENKAENRLCPIRVGIVNKGGQGERIYSPQGHAITQSAYGGGVGAKTGLYNTKQGIRRLTITECKKVMGFSGNHFVSDGMQGYQQLGNAVIPEMVGRVYDGIKAL